MSTTRSPAVAGLFYPSGSQQLVRVITDFLALANCSTKTPKALIVPHAGYRYSGVVAAAAYSTLTHMRKTIRTVVVIGPSHHIGFLGIATPGADYFATPLGNVVIDHNKIAAISDLPFVVKRNDAHFQEHSLEVQIPFLQVLFDNFSIVPIVTGNASAEQVSIVLERLWGSPETLILISSDLSHYHNYHTAQQLDLETSNAIEQLKPELIRSESACGRIPINGLLNVARKLNLQAEVLDLRNSGDTEGSKDRVVGYGAYAFN